MRAVVDTELCEGHALCMQSAPSVFELDENDKAIVIGPELTDDDVANVRDAITRCPVQAISLRAS